MLSWAAALSVEGCSTPRLCIARSEELQTREPSREPGGIFSLNQSQLVIRVSLRSRRIAASDSLPQGIGS